MSVVARSARVRAALRWSTFSLGIGLASLLTGCDLVEAHPTELVEELSARWSEAASGEEGEATSGPESAPAATGSSREERVAAEATGAPREADMRSIGPDEALRVYYQFVDDAGAVQFVERLSDVPPAWRDRVGYLEMAQPPPLTPAEARRTWNLSAARTDEILRRAPAARAPTSESGGGSAVVLYSATWCGYCTKARRHLDDEGVAYQIKDVDIPAVSRELRDKTGRGGVPVLDFGGEILRGYSAGSYDRAIASIRR